MAFRLLLSALLVLALAFTACEKKAPETAKKKEGGPLQVRIAPVATRQLTRIVESVGTLYPYDEVEIGRASCRERV
mgnify:CR=1 FL=1